VPAGGMVVVLDDPAIAQLLNSESGPVGRLLAEKAQVVTQGAKRRCPVSPSGSEHHPSGWLRSSIGWDLGRDAEGLHADIGTDVDYALDVEFGTKPHEIRSHGDWPLRNRKTGQVFGRVVHHPGTRAQPYLRPALDDMRGGG
jgi:hypothetical protein